MIKLKLIVYKVYVVLTSATTVLPSCCWCMFVLYSTGKRFLNVLKSLGGHTKIS